MLLLYVHSVTRVINDSINDFKILFFGFKESNDELQRAKSNLETCLQVVNKHYDKMSVSSKIFRQSTQEVTRYLDSVNNLNSLIVSIHQKECEKALKSMTISVPGINSIMFSEKDFNVNVTDYKFNCSRDEMKNAIMLWLLSSDIKGARPKDPQKALLWAQNIVDSDMINVIIVNLIKSNFDIQISSQLLE